MTQFSQSHFCEVNSLNSPLVSMIMGSRALETAADGTRVLPFQLMSENVQLITLLSMVRLSWRCDIEGVPYAQYDDLVLELRTILNNQKKINRLKRLCDIESPHLLSYVKRLCRSISAQRSIEPGIRQINFGVGILLSEEAQVGPKQLIQAVQSLEHGLNLTWSSFHAQACLSPIPIMLESIQDSEELVSHERFESAMTPSRFTSKSLVAPYLPLVAHYPYVIKGVVHVPEGQAVEFIQRSLMPSQEVTSQKLTIKAQVERELNSAGSIAITPALEAGNLPSIVRFMHFRVRAAHAIQQSGFSKEWAVTYLNKNLRMVNFASRISLSFYFPEESESDVIQYVSKYLGSMGIEDLLL